MKKYVIKSKVRKYPFVCDIMLGICAVYLVSALFLVEADRWFENENIVKVVFFIFAIIYGVFTCVKRFFTYRIITITEKDFTVNRPFVFKTKNYSKKNIKEILFDENPTKKKFYVEAKIYMNNNEVIKISSREFKNFKELMKKFDSKISMVKLERLEKYF